MKRITITLFFVLSLIGAYAQSSFSSKAEAMDYAKKAHNGAILCLQQYTKSNSVEDITAAFTLSSKASAAAQSCFSQNSDVLTYGPDAVKIVRINNYVAAYLFHQLLHNVIDRNRLSIDLRDVTEQFRQNARWMVEMLRIDQNVISWLWGTITEQDIAGIVAFLQLLDKDPDWEENDQFAGNKSILNMMDRLHFDLNLFTEDGKWLLFY